jgi:hypothetical protein
MDPSTDHDPVLVELLAARPDVDPVHTDAGSPAATALRARIVGAESDAEARKADLHRLPRRAQLGRTRWLAAAAAAAAVALVAGGAVVVGVDGPQPAAASIEDIVAATTEAIRGSGQATIAYTETWPNGAQTSASGEAAFAGDDVDLVFRDGEIPEDLPEEEREPVIDANTGEVIEPAPVTHERFEVRQRVADGERYLSTVPLGDDPVWKTDNTDELGVGKDGLRLPLGDHASEYDTLDGDPDFADGWFNVDPRPLLEALQADADFTVIGEEELDGRSVTHLRATELDAISDLDLGLGSLDNADSLDALDVWVDDDDVVYRLDVTVTQDAQPTEILFTDRNDPFVEEGEVCEPGYTPAPEDMNVEPVGDATPCVAVKDPIWVEGSYSVRFHDLGTPVTITPPEDVQGPVIDFPGDG